MKKTILSLALLAGTLAFVNTNAATVSTDQMTIVTDAEQDGYVDVQLADLPEAIQAAINAYAENNTVKSIAYNAESKQTRVVLESNEDQSEKVVILDEEGKE